MRMTKTTGARALVVEDDMEQQKVIQDILEITLKDAKIERAMNANSIFTKLRRAKPSYNIILFDLSFHAAPGLDVLAAVRSEFPGLERNIAVLVNSLQEYQASAPAHGLAYILKPFSLDSFSEIVKQICDRK